MAMSAPQQPSRRVECKVIGTTTAQHAAALSQLLEGMAGLPGVAVLQHWVILKGSPRDELQPEVRLMQQLASFSHGSEDVMQSDRWVVRHEGRPLRGKSAADLPANVRAVTEAQCSGGDVLAFWKAMGFQHDYELLQEGHLYILGREMHLQVLVAKVFRLDIPYALDSKVELSPGLVYVEVTAKAGEGEHAEACKAIGHLAQTIAPLCELSKA